MNFASPHFEPLGTMQDPGKNADNSRSENRNQFAGLLLDGISTGALLLSPEGNVLLSNRAADSLLSLATVQRAGQPLAESIPGLSPDMQKKLSDAVTRSASEPAQGEIVCRIEVETPGAAAPTALEFRFRRLPAHSGLSLPILTEVCEVLGAPSERSTDEARYSQAAIFESTDDAIIVNDMNGVVQSWNPAAARLFGYFAEEIVGQPISRLVPEELRDEEGLIMSKIRAGAGVDYFESIRLAKNGNRLRVSIAVSPIVDADGKIVGATRIARDAFNKYGRNAYRLAAFIKSGDEAIASKTLSGIVTSWNRAAERLFGYKAEEIIGQSITKIIPPELCDEEARILSTVARGGRIDHLETMRSRKDGEIIDISLTVSPVRDETGNVIGAAKVARDITQQKRAERALRTSERLASVGRLAATVAHEINNPLEAVTNLVFLAHHAHSMREAQKYLGTVEEELERISHLTRQTLGFYRETKGVAAVRVGELAESLLSVFAPRMRTKGIQVCTEIDKKIEVIAVPGEIRQVIANLVSNSIDALNTGGQIHLRVSPATQWNGAHIRGVRLTIADTGPGIPQEIRARVFEPFFTTKRDIGTGLGLWICKSIVDNHAGSIQLHSSTTPGKSGTTFSIFLPIRKVDTVLGFPGTTASNQIAGAA